jgi:hypothetical protein
VALDLTNRDTLQGDLLLQAISLYGVDWRKACCIVLEVGGSAVSASSIPAFGSGVAARS